MDVLKLSNHSTLLTIRTYLPFDSNYKLFELIYNCQFKVSSENTLAEFANAIKCINQVAPVCSDFKENPDLEIDQLVRDIMPDWHMIIENDLYLHHTDENITDAVFVC